MTTPNNGGAAKARAHVRKFPHKPDTDKWDRSAGNVARGFAPPIKPCRDCGAPVASGYCCDYCGSTNP